MQKALQAKTKQPQGIQKACLINKAAAVIVYDRAWTKNGITKDTGFATSIIIRHAPHLLSPVVDAALQTQSVHRPVALAARILASAHAHPARMHQTYRDILAHDTAGATIPLRLAWTETQHEFEP